MKAAEHLNTLLAARASRTEIAVALETLREELPKLTDEAERAFGDLAAAKAEGYLATLPGFSHTYEIRSPHGGSFRAPLAETVFWTTHHHYWIRSIPK